MTKNFSKPPAHIKVGLAATKTLAFICFNESPLRMWKNAYYFALKTLVVFEIFTFLSLIFGNVKK